MKKVILFLALISFFASNIATASVAVQKQSTYSQVWQDDDPPQAKDAKETKTSATTKTTCCDKGASKKSCCDSKKPDPNACCDKGPKVNSKPNQEPKK
ncbi:MAG: hypothetical protein ACP5O2_04920 [Bacteroidales bacterium]